MSKYNRTYHLFFSPGTTSDDRIAPSVESLIGVDIVITEKLDGENTGMVREGVYARSHSSFTTSPWSKEVRQIHSLIRNSIDDGVYLFGENLEGIHSIEYTNLTSYFYLFNVRDNGKWLSWNEVEEYAFLLDLQLVPVLFKGVVQTEKELKDLTEKLVKQESKLGGQMEGLVVRIQESFNDQDFSKSVLKWVRKGHVQTDQHWTKNWKKHYLKNQL